VSPLFVFKKENTMSYQNTATQSLSTPDLLSMLVGKAKAETLSQTPLSVIFGLRSDRQTSYVCEDQPQYTPAVILSAAKELIMRALSEEISQNAINLNSPQAVKDYLKLLLGGRQQEVFVALFLDAQHRVIASEEMFHGTLTQTSVYPREVVKRALAHNSAAVMFCHNHPSGMSEPSNSDKLLTDALKHALQLVDVRVLDHFIIGDESVMSFAERGLI
jgi:DNA repair protein RadC